MYGNVWLAEGYLWHLLPRQNLLSASSALAKHAAVVCFDGGMILLIQRTCASSYTLCDVSSNRSRSLCVFGGIFCQHLCKQSTP